METTAAEQSKPQVMSVNTFLALWIGMYILPYLIVFTVDNIYWGIIIQNAPQDTALNLVNLQANPVLTIIGFLLMAATYGLITALMQPVLVQRHLGITLPRWFRMSMVGWLVGGFFAYYVEGVEALNPAFTIGGFVLSLLVFWMPSVMIQVTILNRKTKQWWVWPASNVMAIILFAVIYWLLLGGTSVLVLLQPIGFIPASIIQGAITAGAFFQMFPQSIEANDAA